MTDKRSSFRPNKAKAAALATVAVIALAAATYVRFEVIQNKALTAACIADPSTAICFAREAILPIFQQSLFGLGAIAAAILTIAMPNALFAGLTLITAAFGLVLYNVTLSALAIALLVLALARLDRERE